MDLRHKHVFDLLRVDATPFEINDSPESESFFGINIRVSLHLILKKQSEVSFFSFLIDQICWMNVLIFVRGLKSYVLRESNYPP